MNSIENIVVKGFTPRENGDMVIVPSEIVGKSGSDFDIDKLNLYFANYKYDYSDANKNIRVILWILFRNLTYLYPIFIYIHFRPLRQSNSINAS
jgi:hypothetical protein